MKTLPWMFLAFLSGCGSTTIDAVGDSISPKANTIRLYSAIPAKEFFLEIQKGLIGQGYRLGAVKEDLGYIATEPHKIKNTSVRMAIRVEPSPDGSVATAKGEATVGMLGWIEAGAWESACWDSGLSARQQREAFAAMLLALKKIPHARIEYHTE